MQLPARAQLTARALGITAIVLLVSACGQRGPLYLPERPVQTEESLQEGKLIKRTDSKERQ